MNRHIKKHYFFLLLLSLITVSCQGNSVDRTLYASGTCTSKQVENTQVHYVSIKDKPTLVIWADYAGTEANTCQSPYKGSYKGEISEGSRRIEWEWGSPDGKQNIVAINGIQFVFDKGNVFLINFKGDSRIQQLQRDLKSGSNTIERLSKDDSEIQKFVQSANQP